MTQPTSKPTRVIVCGSRRYTDAGRIEARLELIPQPFILVQGACPRGADAIAAEWAAKQKDVTVEAHPAQWDSFGPAAGPIRNAAMVALGADLLLAWPTNESRGTWDCVNKAKAAGIPIEVDHG